MLLFVLEFDVEVVLAVVLWVLVRFLKSSAVKLKNFLRKSGVSKKLGLGQVLGGDREEQRVGKRGLVKPETDLEGGLVSGLTSGSLGLCLEVRSIDMGRGGVDTGRVRLPRWK